MILATASSLDGQHLLSLLLIIQLSQPCLPAFHIPVAPVEVRILSFQDHLQFGLIHRYGSRDFGILGDFMLLVVSID
ncbi:hypothetical protein HanPI659440_Chr04g0159421 [Helianthus annuus]|nr:hypothetical protein HanPI659440_Chr04g0159421 [Helianthus annuus]